MEKIIKANKSVIIAADVRDPVALNSLGIAAEEVPGISAFKVGITLGLKGIENAVNIIAKRRTHDRPFPVIYDHQKAGNDIPGMGKQFALTLKDAGVDAAILFPFAGPATQEEWTNACISAGLRVLVGGIMTHSKFLVSEGGYISDDAPERIFRLAAKMGIKDFVVPGNKLDWVKKLRSVLADELDEGNFVLYAPGFITQEGDISECGKVAGEEWHAIVGSAIYGKERLNTPFEMIGAAKKVTSQIT